MITVTRPRGRLRRFITVLVCSVAVYTPALVHPTAAWADDVVTYEVVSDDIQIANIEYQDISGRASVEGVTLPWRTDALVQTVRGAPPDGSQLRADWRPSASPSRWVSVRIIYQGRVICQNTLDIGDAACYGITPRIT
jgi:hypothetical protein